MEEIASNKNELAVKEVEIDDDNLSSVLSLSSADSIDNKKFELRR